MAPYFLIFFSYALPPIGVIFLDGLALNKKMQKLPPQKSYHIQISFCDISYILLKES